MSDQVNIKVELASIQLMLNKQSLEILEKPTIPMLDRFLLKAHNDFIINEIEKLKQKS